MIPAGRAPFVRGPSGFLVLLERLEEGERDRGRAQANSMDIERPPNRRQACARWQSNVSLGTHAGDPTSSRVSVSAPLKIPPAIFDLAGQAFACGLK